MISVPRNKGRKIIKPLKNLLNIHNNMPEHNYLELGCGFRQRVFKSLALTLESFLSLGNSFNLVLSSDDSTYLTCFLRGLLR